MRYAFVLGPVAVVVRYWEEHGEEREGGARVELRRVDALTGQAHRPGAEGFRVLPVADGGIWRADLFTLLGSPGNEPRHHHHPHFRHGDVGPRVFDPELTGDPVGWTVAKLADLRALLLASGAAHLAEEVDPAALRAALPLVRRAIEACLVAPATA